MKKILHSYKLSLFVLTMMVAILQACEKDEMNGPVITSVTNYAASPNDSAIQSLLPGQWVVLNGHNLQDAVQILFNGVPANFNSGLFADNHAVVQVPAVIPFPTVSQDKLNTIQYFTPHGSTTIQFNIVAPAPTIQAISNENANTGDSVYIYGTNLFLLTKVNVAGIPITEYVSSPNGTSVGFVLPELTEGGPVVVANKSGKDSTVYHINDQVKGVLCNFDNVSTFSWGTNIDNSDTDFPSNRGAYAVLYSPVLSAGDGSWWNSQRSINTNAVQWIPVSQLNDSIENYAFKFEINVPDDWQGTSILVLKDYTWTYVALCEPWKDANGNTFPYKTKGWRTITIPLTEFRTNNGKGTSVKTLTDLLGASANGVLNVFTVNNGSKPTDTGLRAAVDNLRVVKFK
jgi:hypothetical protein